VDDDNHLVAGVPITLITELLNRKMNKVRRIINILSKLGGYLAGWLVPVMIVLIIFEVFMRYVLHKPPMIADEFSALMLVMMAYLGAAYTYNEGGHVRITAFVNLLPISVSNWLRVTTLMISLAFLIGLTKGSYDYMAMSFKFHFSSPSWLNVPLQVPQMTLAIGFTLLSLVLAAKIVTALMDIRSGRKVDEGLL